MIPLFVVAGCTTHGRSEWTGIRFFGGDWRFNRKQESNNTKDAAHNTHQWVATSWRYLFGRNGNGNPVGAPEGPVGGKRCARGGCVASPGQDFPRQHYTRRFGEFWAAVVFLLRQMGPAVLSAGRCLGGVGWLPPARVGASRISVPKYVEIPLYFIIVIKNIIILFSISFLL